MQKILSVDICQRVANQMQPFFSRLNFPIHQPSVKLLRMQLRNHIHRRTYTLPHKRSGLTLVLTCSSDVYYTWKHTITLNLSLLTIDNNPIPCICNTPPPLLYSHIDFLLWPELPRLALLSHFSSAGGLKKRKKEKGGHWHFLYLRLDLYFRTMLWLSPTEINESGAQSAPLSHLPSHLLSHHSSFVSIRGHV